MGAHGTLIARGAGSIATLYINLSFIHTTLKVIENGSNHTCDGRTGGSCGIGVRRNDGNIALVCATEYRSFHISGHTAHVTVRAGLGYCPLEGDITIVLTICYGTVVLRSRTLERGLRGTADNTTDIDILALGSILKDYVSIIDTSADKDLVLRTGHDSDNTAEAAICLYVRTLEQKISVVDAIGNLARSAADKTSYLGIFTVCRESDICIVNTIGNYTLIHSHERAPGSGRIGELAGLVKHQIADFAFGTTEEALAVKNEVLKLKALSVKLAVELFRELREFNSGEIDVILQRKDIAGTGLCRNLLDEALELFLVTDFRIEIRLERSNNF